MTPDLAAALVRRYAPTVTALAAEVADELRRRWPSCAPEVRIYSPAEHHLIYRRRYPGHDRICAGHVAWTDPGTGGHRVAAIVVLWDTGEVRAVGLPG